MWSLKLSGGGGGNEYVTFFFFSPNWIILNITVFVEIFKSVLFDSFPFHVA